MEKPLIEKKKLAPLNDGGPTQLLNVQIQRLEQENNALKLRIKTVSVKFFISVKMMKKGSNPKNSRF